MKTFHFVKIMKPHNLACLFVDQIELMAIPYADLVISTGSWSVDQSTNHGCLVYVQLLTKATIAVISTSVKYQNVRSAYTYM